MTAARPLTKKQQATYDRIEAAEPAPESYAPEPVSDPEPAPDGPAASSPADAPTEATEAPERPRHVVPAGALAVRPDQRDWTPDQVAALRAMQFKKDVPGHAELQVFLTYSQRTGLDPFARQIYMVGRWNNRESRMDWTIQTGIDGARVVAQRSREYAGQTPAQWCGADGVWKDVWLEEGEPAAARVGIHRRGFTEPLYAVARMKSYRPSPPMDMMWRKMPDVMLAKVAEMLGLRKAFPQDLAGLYVDEEMQQADTIESHVIESRPADPPAPQVEVDPDALAAGFREAMCLAATADRPGLSAHWKAMKDAGTGLGTVTFAGNDGTLLDLIGWLGKNLMDGAQAAASDWVDENVPDPAAEPGEALEGVVVKDYDTAEVEDPWAADIAQDVADAEAQA